jgi:hypothetical protein
MAVKRNLSHLKHEYPALHNAFTNVVNELFEIKRMWGKEETEIVVDILQKQLKEIVPDYKDDFEEPTWI